MGLILLTLISAQRSLLSDDLRDLLHESLSGERAKDHVIQITRHNRIQGSRGYRNAAQYVLQQLRRSGFSDRNALSAEFRPIRQREVKRYLEDLIKVGVLKWK